MIRSNRKNRGISTVFGTVLALILIITASSVLFIALYGYNDSIQQAIAIEDQRSQEEIVMTDLAISNGYVTGITVKNIGSVTSQIKAFYLNNQFICDPSDPSFNQNGAYINAQQSELINLQPTLFDPVSYITIATSRGIRAIEQESHFLNGSSSGFAPVNTYYGPLRLNFTLFYYRATDGSGTPIGTWQSGANVSSTVSYCEWNITVTNIDTRDVTLNQYSSLTLVTNEGGSQYPWYISNPSLLIQSNKTANIIYKWTTPVPCTSAQGFQGFSSLTSKVFLTFYGKFSDKTTYGQTIPFEAVLRLS